MSWLEITDYRHPDGWQTEKSIWERSKFYCERLEKGGILFFPFVPFNFSATQQQQLLSKKQSGLRFHKNISYRPKNDELRGFSSDTPSDTEELRTIMRAFSKETIRFVQDFLRPYVGHFIVDFASYRPLEESGRKVSLHKRNDLLHVDAFPTRPTGGNRILRVFININPERSRSWITGEDFPSLANRYALAAGLEKIVQRSQTIPSKIFRHSAALIRKLIGGSGSIRTAYDLFMLRFHDWLKENSMYQQHGVKQNIDFPPGSTWLVYTDAVPHAVLTGQFALEQTFLISVDGMVTPEVAPIRVLEQLSGQRLAA